MKLNFIIIILLGICTGNLVNAQTKPNQQQKEAQRLAAEAQQALAEGNFEQAEAKYREAISKDPNNPDIVYNLGNLYYTKEKNKEAGQRLHGSTKVTQNKAAKHRAFHNLGNTFMKQKQYEQAVEAYKEALRNNPADDETRYNYALAREKLKQEQEENNDKNEDKKDDKEDKNKDQNQDQQDNQDKKEGGDKKDADKNKDQQDKQDKNENQDKEDKKQNDDADNKENQQKEGDENEEKNKPEQDEASQNKQPQPMQGQMSEQQIKNLLEAMENQERKVQEKINAKRESKGQKRTTDKDW